MLIQTKPANQEGSPCKSDSKSSSNDGEEKNQQNNNDMIFVSDQML